MVNPLGDDDELVGIESAKSRAVIGPVDVKPYRVGPAATRLKMGAQGRRSVGKA